jgi:hypothetical protein
MVVTGGCFLVQPGDWYSVAVKNGSRTDTIYDVDVGTPIPAGGREMSPLVCAMVYPISEPVDTVPVDWTSGGVRYAARVPVGPEMTPTTKGCLLFVVGPGDAVTLYRLPPGQTGLVFEKQQWPPTSQPAGVVVRVTKAQQ